MSVREERPPPPRPLHDGGDDPGERHFMRVLRSGGQSHAGPSSIDGIEPARNGDGIRFDGRTDISCIKGRGTEVAELSSMGGSATSQANVVLAISPHLDFNEFIRRQQGWLSVHKAR